MINFYKQYLLRVLRKIFLKIKNPFYLEDVSFEKKFKSYMQAKKYSSKITSYLNSEMDTYNASQFNSGISFSEVDRNIIVPFVINFIKENRIRILDVGGGGTPISSYIKKLSLKQIDCWILEREAFVKKILPVANKKKQKINYVSDYKFIINKKFDIIYFGSSLQYIDNYKLFIKELLHCNPEFIIITDTIFTKFKSNFFSLQINMQPSVFPIQIFSEDNFINLMKKYKYRCIFNFNNPSKHTHRDIEKKKYNFKHFIFKKI